MQLLVLSACRGLLGLRNAMLTATKGTAVLNTNFAEYGPYCGDMQMREFGSLLSWEQGQATSYAIDSIQSRGRLFISPGEDIYENQVHLPPVIHRMLQDRRCLGCKQASFFWLEVILRSRQYARA